VAILVTSNNIRNGAVWFLPGFVFTYKNLNPIKYCIYLLLKAIISTVFCLSFSNFTLLTCRQKLWIFMYAKIIFRLYFCALCFRVRFWSTVNKCLAIGNIEISCVRISIAWRQTQWYWYIRTENNILLSSCLLYIIYLEMMLIHRFMPVKQLLLNCSSTINTNKHKWAQPFNFPI
jgi:hypothetical protein